MDETEKEKTVTFGLEVILTISQSTKTKWLIKEKIVLTLCTKFRTQIYKHVSQECKKNRSILLACAVETKSPKLVEKQGNFAEKVSTSGVTPQHSGDSTVRNFVFKESQYLDKNVKRKGGK